MFTRVNTAFKKRALLLALACALALSCALAGCASRDAGRSENVTITVWTYYNGDQLAAFNALIEEFNHTVGAEKGIVVEGSNMGSVDDLRDAVMSSANGIVGAAPMPNVFMSYADTAYAIDQMGLLADLSPYLEADERSQFVDGYLEEGALGEADSIKIFPLAKSVEVLLVNETDFAPFAQDTGVTYDDLTTFEGMAEAGRKYYEWTDAQTPEPNDGKAFSGRDSMANYFYIGAKQLGVDIVTVDGGQVTLNFDKDVIRTLWDNYYIPYVRGYFDATGRYRSDDVKTGDIISLIGSSSGATFFPEEVIDEDGNGRAIELKVLPCPKFEGGQDIAVQQGAGMAVIDKSDEEVQASIDFLRWFAQPQQNLKFSISSGYLPVMDEANSIEAVRESGEEIDATMEQILEVAMDETRNNTLYTTQAFEHGTEFRSVLEHSMSELAASDRQVIEDQLASGMDYEVALVPFVSDAHFDQWYNSTLAQLEELI